jgi:DNA helicase-2/ATP-dependent DNA helicase PcrA
MYSLSRAINTPRRKIGTKTFAELLTVAQKREMTPGNLLLMLADENCPELDLFSKAGGRRLAEFGKLLNKWRGIYESLPPVETVDVILSDIDFKSYLEDGSEDGYERWDNINELRRLASEYQAVGLIKFLEDVALVSDQDTLESNLEVPTLLTLHSAKGLEFNQVIIIGLNEGILPHQRSFDEPEAMEEERRLFYVGITRAKDRLYLFHSLNRYSFGYFEPLEASRYYRDIPLEARSENDITESIKYNQKPRQEINAWKDIQQKNSLPENKEIEYLPGQKVKHPKWGEGLVLNSVLLDDDEVVDIFFDGVGKKKLIASLANLEKLSK